MVQKLSNRIISFLSKFFLKQSILDKNIEAEELSSGTEFILSNYKQLISDRDNLEYHTLSRGGKVTRALLSDQVFHACNANTPTPIGNCLLTNGKYAYVIAWNCDFKSLGLGDIIECRLLLRFIPTPNYPNLLLILGLNDGQLTSGGKISYLSGEHSLSIQDAYTRVILYELAQSSEITVMLFDGKSTSSRSFSFCVSEAFHLEVENEMRALFTTIPDYKNDISLKMCQKGMDQIANSFIPGGLLATKNGADLFMRRLSIKPGPSELFWKDVFDQIISVRSRGAG